MKTVKTGLMVIGMLVACGTYAQETTHTKETAQKKTEVLAHELKLTEEQKQGVLELNIISERKNEVILNNDTFTDEEKKTHLQSTNKARREQLRKILTEEQYKKYVNEIEPKEVHQEMKKKEEYQPQKTKQKVSE